MEELMNNEPAITIDQHDEYNRFEASPEAIARIKGLSDADFEKEIQQFDADTQTFLRIVRNI